MARVVRKVDNTIHPINHYPVDSVVCFVNTYPLDSGLSGRWIALSSLRTTETWSVRFTIMFLYGMKRST